MKSFKNLLNSGEEMIGTWSQSSSSDLLEILGYSGFDFTIIDLEHGHFGMGEVLSLLRTAEAVNLPALVRVPSNTDHYILKVLDMGAKGVVVPQIESLEDAKYAINSAKYYPEGSRGSCPCIRAGNHIVTDWTSFSKEANIDTIVALIIEGEEALNQVEDIIKLKGLDAIVLGPFDMSVALGVGGQLNHYKVTDFMDHIFNLCNKYNVNVIIPNFQLEEEEMISQMEDWRKKGGKHFTVGTDKLFIANYFQNLMRNLKGRALQ